VTTVLDVLRVRRNSLPRPAARLVGAVLGWITLVLAVDARAGSGVQWLLGGATWGVLAILLVREAPLVRVQTLVVVVFASCVEYTFSPLLGVYLYRFHNVPAYVPPGHGLVYLAALAIGRTAFVRARARGLSALVLAFLRWGPSPGLYVGAFVVVTYLELLGTSLGTWTWQPHDPTGIVSIGNPPSGAAGGYGWFDLAALLVGPAVLVRVRSAGRRLRRQALPAAADAGS